MASQSVSVRRIGILVLAGFLALIQAACGDIEDGPAAPLVPQFSVPGQQGLDRAIEAQQRHTAALMRLPGVVGTAVGLTPAGVPVIRVFLSGPEAPPLPDVLEGIPVAREVTGLFMARSDPTQRLRPAPLGYSVGHPMITAGTIGARVVDVAGDVHILSNNHVLAAINDGSIGDGILQPGAYDGGTLPADQVGTLSAFQPIDFSGGNNLIDAATALTTRNDVGNSTPLDDGYGAPSTTIWGDANGDGTFDNRNALLNLDVQKYGRTTKLTQGRITGVNGTVSVCYEAILFLCLRAATFVDQLIVGPGAFSDGGDSGSLIVSLIGNQPVGLLFAGSSTQTIANRIDNVLNRFGVAIDDGTSPPPSPFLDVAISAVNAPATATAGDAVDVTVTVRNLGNQEATGFNVALNDVTDAQLIGVQAVSSLAAGQTTNRTFTWNTAGASTGMHTLRATHDLSDGDASNDVATTTVDLGAPGTLTGIHVGDLDGMNFSGGNPWSAVVEVTIHDQNHQPINGATVNGVWEPSGLASDQCTTGEGGGLGTCIFLYPNIRRKRVTFTVTSVILAGQTYEVSANHDPDGDSDGTTITVTR